MPSTSKKQRNFMEAVANNTKFAKKVGVPTAVGKEFTKSGGGMAKANPFMEMIAKKKTAKFEKSGKDVEKKGVKEGSKADMALDKKQMGAMKKGGKVKKYAAGGLASGHKSVDGVASKGKTKGKQI